jgi:hypothetical protein
MNKIWIVLMWPVVFEQWPTRIIFNCQLSIVICLLAFFQVSACSQVGNSFIVTKDSKPQVYDRMIFGQFIEHFRWEIMKPDTCASR